MNCQEYQDLPIGSIVRVIKSGKLYRLSGHGSRMDSRAAYPYLPEDGTTPRSLDRTSVELVEVAS